MTERKTASKVSTKNTKEELLTAYHALAKQLEEKEPKAKDKAEDKAARQAVEIADSLSTVEIAKQAGSLKAELSKILGELTDRMEDEIAKYRQVKKAVQTAENDLQEIYEIQRAATSLEALIEAQRLKREEFEAESAAEREELTREMDMLRSEWDREKKLLESEAKERESAEAKKREREKEEYRYAFAREQNSARDLFEDQKGKLEREILYRKEVMERELAQREQQIAQREAELDSLRKRVDAQPKELEAAVARAIKEQMERLTSEAKNREELLIKGFTGERDVLTTKIQALETKVVEQNDQLAKMSQRLEKAYSQVQDIAVKAIEGSGISKSLSSLQQLLSEQSKRSPQEK